MVALKPVRPARKYRALYNGKIVRTVSLSSYSVALIVIILLMFFVVLLSLYVKQRCYGAIVVGWSLFAAVTARTLALKGKRVLFISPRTCCVYHLTTDGEEIAVEGLPRQHIDQLDTSPGPFIPLTTADLEKLCLHTGFSMEALQSSLKSLIDRFPPSSSSSSGLDDKLPVEGEVVLQGEGGSFSIKELANLDQIETARSCRAVETCSQGLVSVLTEKGICFTSTLITDFPDCLREGDVITGEVVNILKGTFDGQRYLLVRKEEEEALIVSLPEVGILSLSRRALFRVGDDLLLNKEGSIYPEEAVNEHAFCLETPRPFKEKEILVLHPFHLPSTHDVVQSIAVVAGCC